MYDYMLWYLGVIRWLSLLLALFCLLPLVVGLLRYIIACCRGKSAFNRNKFNSWSYYNCRSLYNAYWSVRTLIIAYTFDGGWIIYRRKIFYPFFNILTFLSVAYLLGLWFYLDCGSGVCAGL